MTTISSNNSGGNYISGIASGLDTKALIQAAVSAKLKKADRIDDTISKQAAQISAYTQLQKGAQDVQEALSKLQSATSDSVFRQRQVTTKSSGTTSADNILTATASANAKFGTYQVSVQQLAKAMTVTGGSYASTTAALGISGSFKLSLDGYTSTTITLTATMGLKDIAAAIDAVAAASGVEADLMRTGNGYTLALSGKDTAKSFTVTDTSGVLAQLGLVDGAGAFTHISQQAQQAVVNFNGTTVTSNSNILDNVVSGLTLNLSNAAPDTTISIEIGDNTEGVKEAVQEFIEAYNALRAYLDKIQEVGSTGSVSNYAYLFGDNVARSMTNDIAGLLSKSYGTGGYNSLGALGISIDENSQLVWDEDVFDAAMEADFAALSDGMGRFADSMHSTLERYASAKNGSLQTRIDQLTMDNNELTVKSDAIKDRAESYEQTLITRYSAMETKILSAQLLKKQIEAILTGSTKHD